MDVPQTRVDWRSKGFWLPGEEGGQGDQGHQGHQGHQRDEMAAADYAATKPSLFDGGFTWPLMVLRQAAAEKNIATMAEYTRRHGLDFAPHAKTTMAPGLLAAQFAAGAWGMTVATPNQALVLRKLGVERVLIANEVLDATALRWLAREGAAGWQVWFQVDSIAGVQAAWASGGPVRVLVELGHANGRTGVRTLDELEAVARAAEAAPGVRLAGVTAYEGQLQTQQEVDDFLDLLVAGVKRLRQKNLLGESPLISAGGSAWFDRVVDRLKALPDACRVVLRSGAAVSHDDGYYRERTPFLRVPAEGPLAAALEVWAQVQSVPEPGLAIAGMGKRDAPVDEGLPVALGIRRVGGSESPATGVTVTKLNDHHTYLSTGDVMLTPGDLVRFGISHPCTAFDKWRDIPVVDEDRRVVDILHTYF